MHDLIGAQFGAAECPPARPLICALYRLPPVITRAAVPPLLPEMPRSYGIMRGGGGKKCLNSEQAMSAEYKNLRDRFIKGMGLSASTVNVVTTDGRAGRAGVTVSAMTSVSADGDLPTLLVCIHHLSPAAQTIVDNKCFCTNVLKDNQIYISDIFAGRQKPENGDKFSCARWRSMPSGAPRAEDPLAAFDCRVKSNERVGTHHVFIGEVEDIFISPHGNPLIYANRAYGSPVRINNPARSRNKQARCRIGAFHTFGPYVLPALLRKIRDDAGGLDLDLYEGDQRYLTELLYAGEIDFAFLYDLDLDDGWEKRKITEMNPYVLLAANAALARRAEISVRELQDKPMVLLDAPPSGDYFISLFDGAGAPNIAYRTRSFEMARGMVAHGLGYSLLATKPASSMSYDGKALVTRPLAENPTVSSLVLCSKKHGARNAAAARFLQHCNEHFGGVTSRQDDDRQPV
ncbi:MAG: LysR substrate-binding domain-containing protein [Gammaproteobacteria bacterium]